MYVMTRAVVAALSAFVISLGSVPSFAETDTSGSNKFETSQVSEEYEEGRFNEKEMPGIEMQYFSKAGKSGNSPKVTFSMPDNCTLLKAGILHCDQSDELFRSVVLTADGKQVPHQAEVNPGELDVVASNSFAPEDALVFALISGSSESVLSVVEDTFQELLSEDGRDPVFFTSRVNRPSKVQVPKSYVYCKKFNEPRCQPKSLHDYCTWSPDSFRYGKTTADFRGPCARHDMSIDKIRKKQISVASKRRQRSVADSTFKGNLRQNCNHAFYRKVAGGNPERGRVECHGQVAVYYAAVSLKTRVWNGR
ncbi:hypothetical protein [Brevibacterium ravenspurgense]|uniref:hypothetical protein n=1 Tax=Brevibacterium ravenspurgense TaxID=479117 RepID=UPI00077856A3|nr:hypothetical protein [Brevibacterium ravenspurgense]